MNLNIHLGATAEVTFNKTGIVDTLTEVCPHIRQTTTQETESIIALASDEDKLAQYKEIMKGRFGCPPWINGVTQEQRERYEELLIYEEEDCLTLNGKSEIKKLESAVEFDDYQKKLDNWITQKLEQGWELRWEAF